MVEIEEVENMFWGVTLDGGKRYTQTVETSFHISNAALDVGSNTGAKPNRVAVMIQHEKAEFLLCTLDNKSIFQHSLDLNFTEGEEVTFFLNGKGVVHLTGYLVPEGGPEDEFDSRLEGLSESEDEDVEADSDEDIPMLQALKSFKRKGDDSGANAKKKLKTAPVDEDEEDSDDSEDPSFSEMVSFEDDSDDDDSEDDDSEDEDDSDDDDDDEDDDDDSDDEEEDSDEEDDSEDGEQDMTGSFLEEKKQKTPAKAEKKTPQAAEKKTPKSEPKKSPKSEAKKTPKVEAKQEQTKTPKSEKKQKGQDKTPAGKKSAANTPVAAKVENAATPGSKKKKKDKSQTPQATGAAASPANGVTPGKKAKTPQAKSPQSEKQQNAASLNSSPKSEKKKKKKAKENSGTTPQGKAKKTVLSGGIVMEELKAGNGPEAKNASMVHVYYKGCLQSGKVFDACTSGKPFKFRLGKQEVIRGWDIGVAGMKVGGKRKLTIPASQAYGTQRVGTIPPNSTLEFQVELKSVS